MSLIKTISLGDIRADTSAQPRALLLADKVSEYVERMTEGDAFPPMVVFFDGKINWLADGFHRYHAAFGTGLANFPCDVREGGLRDAVLFSCGANAAHGVPRTLEDKRRAVMKLLQDGEWSHWSDREIARHAKVHHEMVGRLRPPPAEKVTGVSASEDRTYTTKHGTVARTNTANIGKRPSAVEPQVAKVGEIVAAKSQSTGNNGMPQPSRDSKPSSEAEVPALGNALRVGFAALDPILDRIAQIGIDVFWRQADERVRKQVEGTAQFLQMLTTSGAMQHQHAAMTNLSNQSERAAS
jgi:hypothetical protein